eukprot:TRINITY_DN21657_c0_g1_i1.p1 TRINITY_DN21657_c0_g1~~TRINITY_DN21657_c0_g1_i1.p1  ORF type:complete len:893 (+),score=128.15 TRINITY_DN21657_c0_g1_i1:108-2786(+)
MSVRWQHVARAIAAAAVVLWVPEGQLFSAEDESCEDAADRRSICDQVVAIAQAAGKTECQYRRDFFECMRRGGCYYLSGTCRDASGREVDCTALCEAEALLDSCRDPRYLQPPQDYHLCPHITKDSLTTRSPTLADFLAAPGLPYTLTVWTTFRAGSDDPAKLLPEILPTALGLCLGRLFGINPLAVILTQPVGHHRAALTLPGELPPPVWTEHTSFIAFNIHIRNQTDKLRVQIAAQQALLGGTGTTETEVRNLLRGTESILSETLNESTPVGVTLLLSQVQIRGKQGLVAEFPTPSETTLAPTTTTELDLALQVKRMRAWRVRCLDGVVYRWQMRELELWADSCPDQGGTTKLGPNALFTAFNSSFYSSEFSVEEAFDGNLETSWISECAGCPAGKVWIGLDSGPLNLSFRVACVTLTQGVSASDQCGRISIEASDNLIDWEGRGVIQGLGPTKSFCVLKTREDYRFLSCGVLDDGCQGQINFGVCAGSQETCLRNRCVCTGRLEAKDARFAGWQCGTADDGCGSKLSFGSCDNATSTCFQHYCKEDILKAYYWRLVCMGETVGRWQVRELRFHLDGLCTLHQNNYIAVSSSGSMYSNLPAINAFDGDTSTPWISQCRNCQTGEAWLSVRFAEKLTIRCVHLIQDSKLMGQCPKLTLQYSDDSRLWLDGSRYGFNGLPVGEDTMLQAELDERSAQDVELHLRFAKHWRIACMLEMDRQWGVYEIEFYDNKECNSPLRSAADGILSSHSSSWPNTNAYDQSEYTIWKTNCGQCDSSTTLSCKCAKGEAYLGIKYIRPVVVKCVRIIQLEAGPGSCPSISVQLSDLPDGPWIMRQEFQGVEGISAMPMSEDVKGSNGADESTSEAHELSPRAAAMFLLILMLCTRRYSTTNN